MDSLRVFKISDAAKFLGVSIDTLRRWENDGKISPQRTNGGIRLYSLEQLALVKQEEESKLSISEAAKILGISTKTLRRWDQAGKFTPRRSNSGERVYLREEVQKLLEKPVSNQPWQILEIKREFEQFPSVLSQKIKPGEYKSILVTTLLGSVLLVSLATLFNLILPRSTETFFTKNPLGQLLYPANGVAKGLLSFGSVALPKPQIKEKIAQNTQPKPQSQPKPTPTDPNHQSEVLGIDTEVTTTDISSDIFYDDLKLAKSTEYIDLLGKAILDSYGNIYPEAGVKSSIGTWDRKFYGIYANRFTVDKDGNIKVFGTTTLGDANADNVNFNGRLGSDIIPSSTSTLSLGNGDIYFKDAYVSNVHAGTGVFTSISAQDFTATQNIFLPNGTAAAPALAFSNSQGSGLYRIASNKIGLITSGSETSGITIDSSGLVGLGTTDPGSRLQVSGATALGYSTATTGPANGLAVSGSVGIGTTSPGAPLDVIGSGNNVRFRSSATANWNGVDFINTTGAANQLYSNFSGSAVEQEFILGTYTNRANQLSLDTNGRVGLGVTNPATQLEVAGAITLAGAQAIDITTNAGTSPTALIFQPGNNTTNSGTGASFTLRGGNESGTTSTGGNLVLDPGTGTSTNGAINIGSNTAGAINIGDVATAKTITIGSTATDIIDIGNAASNAKTVRIGSGAVANTITIGSASSTGVSITDNNWSVTTDGAATFVGVNSGSGLIQGTGGLTLTGTTSINNDAGTSTTSIGTGTTTGQIIVGGTGTQTIDIGNGAGVKTVNLGSSNTTSATTLLSGSGGISLNASNNQPTNINTGNSTGAIGIGNSLAAAITLASGAASSFTITNGNLTLATTGASGTNGVINLTSALASGNTATSAFNITASTNLDVADELLQFGDSGGTFMTILGGGNVGIGTTAPNFKISGVDTVNSANAFALTNLSTTADTSTSVLRLNIGTVTTDTNARFMEFYGGSTADNNGTRMGRIQLNNTGVAYNTGNADFAEYFEVSGSFENGDLISIATNGNHRALKNERLLGVVSDSAGFVGNAIYEKPDSTHAIVGLTGQIKTKVSTENGVITKGDLLSASTLPGVAMKATKPGPTIGQALEDYSGGGVAKILVYVSAGFGDPTQALSSINIDNEGKLIVPDIKVGVLSLNDALLTLQTKDGQIESSLTQVGERLDNLEEEQTATYQQTLSQITTLHTQSISLETRVQSLESSTSAQLADLSNQVAGVSTESTKLASSLNSQSEIVSKQDSIISSLQDQLSKLLAENSPEVSSPEDLLIASDSANLNPTFNSLAVTSDTTISGALRAYGDTRLNNTSLAGVLTIDGSMSFGGDSINVIGSPLSDNAPSNSGILYLQNSIFASVLDIFNGKVRIDKEGALTAQELALSGQVLGSANVAPEQLEVTVPASKIKISSKVFLTPASPLIGNLYIKEIKEGESFTVSLTQTNPTEIKFNWFVIQSI